MRTKGVRQSQRTELDRCFDICPKSPSPPRNGERIGRDERAIVPMPVRNIMACLQCVAVVTVLFFGEEGGRSSMLSVAAFSTRPPVSKPLTTRSSSQRLHLHWEISLPLVVYNGNENSMNDSNHDNLSQHLCRAFNEIVESTEFFEVASTLDENNVDTVDNSSKKSTVKKIQSSHSHDGASVGSCRIPLFGSQVTVQMQLNLQSSGVESPQQPRSPKPTRTVTLSIDNCSDNTEISWICTKFYESRASLQGILDLSVLHPFVVAPPSFSMATTTSKLDPGVPAASAPLAGSTRTAAILKSSPTEHDIDSHQNSIMARLQRHGYVVVDAPELPRTNLVQHAALTDFLTEKSGQGDSIRTDTVHYLTRAEAAACGLTDHFDVLTSLASYLNENYEIEESPYKPLLPATEDSPLTNPERIQLAEYENSGFYTAHSDNPIVQDSGGSGLVRENFRRFTAILYMNEGWTKGDGGAVRLYLRSQALQYVQEVYSESEEPRWHVVDVLPSNGRLLLFDSRLVHSVEPVLSEQKRRALTLWIKRPIEGGV
jgi:hypothetical protein